MVGRRNGKGNAHGGRWDGLGGHLTSRGIRDGEVTQSGLSPLAAPSPAFSHAVVPQSFATLIEEFAQSPVTPNSESPISTPASGSQPIPATSSGSPTLSATPAFWSSPEDHVSSSPKVVNASCSSAKPLLMIRYG